MKSFIRMWWEYRATPWLSNRYDKFCMFLAWHILPHRLVNWAAVRVAVTAAGNDKNPGEVRMADALQSWNK